MSRYHSGQMSGHSRRRDYHLYPLLMRLLSVLDGRFWTAMGAADADITGDIKFRQHLPATLHHRPVTIAAHHNTNLRAFAWGHFCISYDLTITCRRYIIEYMTTDNCHSFDEIRRNIKDFPQNPGIYLMKDANGRVLYVGKAKNLRDRAGSYFQPAADLMQSRGPKIAEMVQKVTEISYLECENEVDAILQEARLIKDIQPPYNSRQTDDKTFPYLEITGDEDFPGVYITRQPGQNSKLYGPFTSVGELRRVIQILQRIFQFRSCHLEISDEDPKRRFFRPCLLHDIKQCSGPCADRISKPAYAQDIKRLRQFLESKRSVVLRQLREEMDRCSKELDYESAAHLRDEIKAVESLSDRGQVDEHVQPELFQTTPEPALEKLTEILDATSPVRVIEGVDIAHIQGRQAVGSLVCFIDGRPFKNNYRRFRIKQTEGIDDYAMIQEVLRRRYRHADETEELYPDAILIDGGLGQLNAALAVFEAMPFTPPIVISLAKKQEQIFIQNHSEPLTLPRSDPALQLLQYVRDEAHRFAQHYFHILQKKQIFK
jgi:excinuclease ABC subunit C